MNIDILICTLNEGIQRVPSVLTSAVEGVRYVVCMQYTDEEALEKVPMKVMTRKDVKLYIHEGKGLSKNRNFALDWADAEICLIADDDNRYVPEYYERITKAFRKYPEADVICFAAESYEGKPMKIYPASTIPYQQAREQGYYPTSMEIAFRRESVKAKGVLFNENFGLGSPLLCAGEEDVFLYDCEKKGLTVIFVPDIIVQSDPDTTGMHFVGNKKLQITKGTTFRYLYGKKNAVYRSIRESLWYLVHKGTNPFPIFFNMWKGINLFH